MEDVTERFYRLTSYVRHYAWGMRRHGDTVPYIAELLGEDPGKNIPWAELWIGAHPSLPSAIQLPGGASERLDSFLAANGERALGQLPPALADTGLPFLLKVLSCERALSIQSHPDLETARRLHDADPAHYPDANHKPEVMLAITPFEAMAGLRPLDEALADIRAVHALTPWHRVSTEARELTLRVLCETLLNLPSSLVRTMLTDLHRELQEQGERASDAARLCLRLLDENPCDRGVLFAFLLQHLRLAPGEALYIPANVPHAYLYGSGIECMANSDNVIRAGLTPKFIDIRTLLATLDFSGRRLELSAGEVLPSGERLYAVPADEFRVSVVEGGHVVDLAGRRPVASLLLVLDGDCDFAGPDGDVQLGGRGTTWFRPACLTRGTVTVRPGARLVIAEIG